MAQQTAVEWLVEQLRMQTPLYTKNEMIEIAKQMEREQHESTCVEVIERILDKLEKGENTNSQDVFNRNLRQMKKHKYELKTYNGRVKIYCDGYVMFAFNQIDFSGYYAYKDDVNLYGIDIYMNRQGAGHQIMEIYFKTKENWLEVLKLLDTI